jgi:hypothetical protein
VKTGKRQTLDAGGNHRHGTDSPRGSAFQT